MSHKVVEEEGIPSGSLQISVTSGTCKNGGPLFGESRKRNKRYTVPEVEEGENECKKSCVSPNCYSKNLLTWV